MKKPQKTKVAAKKEYAIPAPKASKGAAKAKAAKPGGKKK